MHLNKAQLSRALVFVSREQVSIVTLGITLRKYILCSESGGALLKEKYDAKLFM
jgi:hypothetical protein